MSQQPEETRVSTLEAVDAASVERTITPDVGADVGADVVATVGGDAQQQILEVSGTAELSNDILDIQSSPENGGTLTVTLKTADHQALSTQASAVVDSMFAGKELICPNVIIDCNNVVGTGDRGFDEVIRGGLQTEGLHREICATVQFVNIGPQHPPAPAPVSTPLSHDDRMLLEEGRGDRGVFAANDH